MIASWKTGFPLMAELLLVIAGAECERTSCSVVLLHVEFLPHRCSGEKTKSRRGFASLVRPRKHSMVKK